MCSYSNLSLVILIPCQFHPPPPTTPPPSKFPLTRIYHSCTDIHHPEVRIPAAFPCLTCLYLRSDSRGPLMEFPRFGTTTTKTAAPIRQETPLHHCAICIGRGARGSEVRVLYAFPNSEGIKPELKFEESGRVPVRDREINVSLRDSPNRE